jgi:hypothetical protein
MVSYLSGACSDERCPYPVLSFLTLVMGSTFLRRNSAGFLYQFAIRGMVAIR